MADQEEDESTPQLHGLRDVLSGSVPDLTNFEGLHYQNQNLLESQAYPTPLTLTTGTEHTKFPSRATRGRLLVGRPKSQDVSARVPATANLSSHLRFSPSTPAFPNQLFHQNNSTTYSHSPQWSISSADSSSPLYMADSKPKQSRSSTSLNEENDNPASPTPPSSWVPDKRSSKGREGLSHININNNKIQPSNRPSVKHLTCYWWKTKGNCRFSEEDCLYSHHDTGKLAEAPRHLIPGERAVAGRNLEHRLAQYMVPAAPAEAPSLEPTWRVPALPGLSYSQGASKATGTDKPVAIPMRSQHSAKSSCEVPERGEHYQSTDLSAAPETAIDYPYQGTNTPLASESNNQASSDFVTPHTSPMPPSNANDASYQEICSLRSDKFLLQNLLSSSTRDKEFLQSQLTQASLDRQLVHNQLATQQIENQNLRGDNECLQNQLADTVAEKEELERILTRSTATIQHISRNQNTNIPQESLRSSASMGSFLTVPGQGPDPGPIERPQPGKKRATFGF